MRNKYFYRKYFTLLPNYASKIIVSRKTNEIKGKIPDSN